MEYQSIKIGNSEINFKIDTGAYVTVIPEEVFRQCNFGKLHSTSKRLFGADHNGLRLMGTVRDTLSPMRGHGGFLLEVQSHAGIFSPRAANPT